MSERRENEEERCRATGKRIDFSLNAGMILRGGEGRGLVVGKAPPVFSSGLLWLCKAESKQPWLLELYTPGFYGPQHIVFNQ